MKNRNFLLREDLVDFLKKTGHSVNSSDLNAYEDLGAILEQIVHQKMTTVRGNESVF